MRQGIKKDEVVALEEWIPVVDVQRELGLSRFRFMRLAMVHGIRTHSVLGRTVVARESVELLRRELAKAS